MASTFSFAFDPRYAPFLRAAGITPERSSLVGDDHELRVRFGPVTLTTPRSNIRKATVSGPWKPLKAIGVRMSFSDGGLTFGSSVERTACLEFIEPVRAKPVDLRSHPGLTVSVEDPDGLAALINAG